MATDQRFHMLWLRSIAGDLGWGWALVMFGVWGAITICWSCWISSEQTVLQAPSAARNRSRVSGKQRRPRVDPQIYEHGPGGIVEGEGRAAARQQQIDVARGSVRTRRSS